MIRSVMILKFRKGRHSPSARTLRRALRPSRVKIGARVAILLLLFALAMGWIAISLNSKFEKEEHRQHSAPAPHRV